MLDQIAITQCWIAPGPPRVPLGAGAKTRRPRSGRDPVPVSMTPLPAVIPAKRCQARVPGSLSAQSVQMDMIEIPDVGSDDPPPG